MKEWIKSILVIIIIVVIVIAFVKFLTMTKAKNDEKKENECINDCERAGQEFFKMVERFTKHCTCLNKDGEVNEIW